MASRKRASSWFRLGLIGLGLLGLVLVAQAFKHSLDRQSRLSGLDEAAGPVTFAILRDAAPAARRSIDI